jgi:putative membrane protein
MQAVEPMHEHHHHDHEHNHDHTHNSASRVEQIIKIVILFGLGAYFAYNILTGNLANYINERFVWLSYVAVALFFVLGAASLWSMLGKSMWGQNTVHGHHEAPDHDHDHEHHHNHSHSIGWGMIAIAAIPLVLGVLIPSKPLGAEAVDGSIATQQLTYGGATITVLNKPPLERNVLDWLRAFSRTEAYSDFNGEQADVIGFVYREPDYPEDTFLVARFTISCCVADASAIGLPVRWEGVDALPEGSWVRVTGGFDAGQFADRETPILVAQAVEEVEQPEHPYLYP